MFSHMYAFVFSDLQPSFPLCERIRCPGTSQNEGSIPSTRSNIFYSSDLRSDDNTKNGLVRTRARLFATVLYRKD